MTEARKLHLLPDIPNVSNSGSIAVARQIEALSERAAIKAIFDLYLEWPAHRSCRLSIQPGSYVSGELDWDRDEIVPGELKARLANLSGPLALVEGDQIEVSFEIFRAVYVFNAKVLAVAEELSEQDWHVILEFPTELGRIKSRTLPRIAVTDAAQATLGEVRWLTSAKARSLEVRLLEIGLASLKIATRPEILEEGLISFNAESFPVKVCSRNDFETVLQLDLNDEIRFGQYFEIYRKLAYPSLRNRYDLPLETGIDVYRRSEYLGRSDQKLDDISGDLIETWKRLRPGNHVTNVDYVIVSPEGEAIGSSGLAITHLSNGIPSWIFHQLCAVKTPELVALTGVLYTWRSEYLAARPGDLKTWVTFRSSSRWVERIYVKYSLQARQGSRLVPIKMMRASVAAGNAENQGVAPMQLGEFTRYCCNEGPFTGGYGPSLLNASKYNDVLLNVESSSSPQDFETAAGSIATAAGKDEIEIVALVHGQSEFNLPRSKALVPDRYFEIEKNALTSLVCSVEHSIAVTEKKLLNGTAS